MKPVTLVMSDFGSYMGRHEIDFSGLENGIFLISGNTGAGKTSIFDAVTYALYGRTSGGRRSGDMMVSHYSDETDSYVEFEFKIRGINGGIYKIRRTPKQMRRSKRKNRNGEYSLMEIPASVSLYMPDGSEYAGKKNETDRKIAEIVGLDAEQFSQTAMLAQGDFMELLQADSASRKRIFQKIFNTGIYGKIEEELKKKSNMLYRECENKEDICIHEMKGVKVFPESPVYDTWENLKKSSENTKGFLDVNGENMLSLLQNIKDEYDEAIKNVESKLSELLNKLEELKERDRFYEKIKNLTAEKRVLEKDIEVQRKSLKDEIANYDAVRNEKAEFEKERNKELPVLNKRIHDMEEALKKYQELKEFQKKYREALNKYKSLELAVNYKMLLEKQDIIKGEKDEYISLENELKKILKLKDNTEKLKKNSEDALIKFKDLYHEYQEYNSRLLMEQAGILAGNLEEGKPCPVCGSVHHPQPAKTPEYEICEELVKEKQRLSSEAEKNKDEKKEKFIEANGRLEADKKVFSDKFERITGRNIENEDIDNPGDIILKIISDRKQELLKSEKEKENEIRIILSSAKKEYGAYNMEIITKKKELSELTEDISKYKKDYDILSYKVDELKKSLPSDSYESALNEYDEIKRKADNFERMMNSLTERLNSSDKKISEYKGRISEGEKQLKRYDAESEKLISGYRYMYGVNMDFSFLDKEKKKLEDEKLMLYTYRNTNEKAFFNISENLNLYKGLRGKFEIVNRLYNTAGGRLSGSKKLDFETYIQRRYFKRVVDMANRRLMAMTEGQFILKCRDIERLSNKGESGLDLDVYSFITDREREVSTLSGGESFMAALAMALGMTDIVRNTTGRINIDTMFIDEGFGSLDDEARNQAVRILNSLAGDSRLIGIISHVSELKEQIERKLIVRKSDKGSFAEWEN